MEVKFYDTVNDELLKFAVVISQSNGKWVFCKHKERDTYEVPGVHREAGEDIFVTAKKLRSYNGKKLAFTVPKGKQVTLKKLTLSKGNIYLQFQYGKKTGWISVNNKYYDFESQYFKKVNSRLAG